MAQNRTIDLLPEIFRTDTNRQLLAATLDQLTQEPALKRTQGYVGRRVGPGVNPNSYYVTETSPSRANYQLEPGITFQKNNSNETEDLITYPGILDAIEMQSGIVNRQDRLFESQYYSWDPMCDLDKFTNYSHYYWLPSGPDSVDVSATIIPLTDNFNVTRTNTSYEFSGIGGDNPTIFLSRGGNYTFDVSQSGHQFWIQAAPGVNGRLPQTPNISSRDVYGVNNNGTDNGIVEFFVPVATAQDFYYNLEPVPNVDLATTLKFSDINNKPLLEFLAQYPQGIDGLQELNNRTIIFLNDVQDAALGGWQIITEDSVTDITLQSQRYSVWLISYVTVDDVIVLKLTSIRQIPNLTKFNLLYGYQYSNVSYYKNASGYFEQVPLLTAAQDTLYYQDSTNPEIFGMIKLVNSSTTEELNINDIVGQKNYTSPNGVVFTNGLKVQFRGNIIPSQYQNQEFYVEGVGTGPGINSRVGFINGQAYFGPFHYYENKKLTGLVHSDDILQEYIYATVEESLANPGAGAPQAGSLPNTAIVSSDLGVGIKLVPASALVTPETYTKSALVPYDSVKYDSTDYDASLNAPLIPDYLTQNRSSIDQNAWSRSNRWFHVDVINYTAKLNNSPVVLNNNQRGRRPIIEFRENLRLWNNGTQSRPPVNVIDFNQTDALSNINGTLGYGIDGYNFIEGTTVIFAADVDPEVRNKTYTVTFVDPTGTGLLVIDLVPATNSAPQLLETVVTLNGLTQQGKTYWFDGVTWKLSQQKTRVNQAPLFDVYDENGFSFGNRAVYPSSTFEGSRIFGYAEGGTSIADDVLGLSLKYLNINNVGDIVFQNYFYTDTFIYVRDRISTEQQISTGFVHQYIDRVSFADQIGWQTAVVPSRTRQTLRFEYQGQPLLLGVPIVENYTLPPVQAFINGKFVDPTYYTISTSDNNSRIIFSVQPELGSIIEIEVISNEVSQAGFYAVPLNLEQNPLNLNSSEFTLGGIRTHYESIAENLKNISGPINGANNSRDLGNIIPYGSVIIQNSSPLTLAGTFFRKQRFDIFSSLAFNSQEYEKYKVILIDLASRGNFINDTSTEILDSVLNEISLSKGPSFPFYWSDMVPNSGNYISTSYTISFIDTGTFDTVYSYDFTSSNYQGLLVYLNGKILTLGYDYTVPAGTSTIVLTSFEVGDVVTIREYSTTYGSFVPNTPTKMGMYPAWRPEIFIDESSGTATKCIRGHDGSITVAYNDVRDNVLLEFELRIFNNLKIGSKIPMALADVMPGQFRQTQYSLEEINQILLPTFLTWTGLNRLDYVRQTYQVNNQFTYNYSQSSDKLNNQPLLGNWRGIYNYFYDTISPTTTPWELIGFSQKPDWWDDVYSAGPYTDGNLVLWRDLEAGLIADPVNPRIDPRYIRPGLTKVIPAASEGALLSPLISVVGNYNATSFRRSWAFGDDGPVESTWRTSSSWPFAVMRLFALTQPAKFFSLMVDRDRYQYNEYLDQYLWDQRYRLDARAVNPIYGSGVSKASYINWIVDYNQQSGIDSSAELTKVLQNIDIRLCWRMGSFSDKSYLKVYTERSTPSGTNNSLLLPDESYQLLVYKNQPYAKFDYSSVMIQTVAGGYSVSGYNSVTNYFEILISKPFGLTTTVSAGGSTVKVPTEYTNSVVQVPYGFVFNSKSAVCDFLFSYGELLSRRGLTLTTIENGYVMNWPQMAQEFLYWSNQGWTEGSIINLNPGATQLTVTRENSVVDSLSPPRPDNQILNQNSQAVKPTAINITRLENTFKVDSLTTDTLNLMRLKFTAYEHVMILDNRSIFADLIYDSVTGSRQSRILISGWLSADWNGTVNAPGFVLNQDNIQDWQPDVKYSKGNIVLFKGDYWSASTIVAPSREFNYNDWLKSDYQDVKTGLLPNAATVSDQLQNAYDINNANLEQETSLFSYGLVGFRPRQYMQALNLDDESQVNLYNQFLGSKGTRPALEIFTFANLGKEIAQYDIYEYWAILRGNYGATANRSYIELQLNAALLPSDPSTVQIVLPQQTSEANQVILLSDVWKSSYKLDSTDILPTTDLTLPSVSFPSAGYVDIDDIDLTVFDLISNDELNANLDLIGVGTTIWVAKVNTYDWNVYRTSKIDGQITGITDNLNGASVVTFQLPHNLTVGQTLIIKEFDPDVNGAYTVLSVPGINTVTIAYEFTGFETSLTGEGLGFILQTSRVAQSSDISKLPYADTLGSGVRVWVNDDGTGHWVVLEKGTPFAPEATLLPQTPLNLSRYGSAVSQGFFNLSALVGAPGYNTTGSVIAPGGVYAYVRTDQNEYAQASILTIPATGVAGYGNALDVGDQTWAVIGASESLDRKGYATTVYARPSTNVFDTRQLLLAPDQDFGPHEYGYSVTLSKDEHWMYISSPGVNRVYAYTQTSVQDQNVEYITDGFTLRYNYSDYIVINPAEGEQLSVVLNNIQLTYNVNYTIDAGDIVLAVEPSAGKTLAISRRTGIQLDQITVSNVAATGGSGGGATFTVNNVRGVYNTTINDIGRNYNVGDTLTINQYDIATRDAIPPAPIAKTVVSNIGPILVLNSTTDLLVGMVVTGTGFDSGQYILTINPGVSITMSADPDSTPSGTLYFSHDIKINVEEVDIDGGIVRFVSSGVGVKTTRVFELDRYLATATNIFSFTVVVDGVIQRPYIDYDFNSDSALYAYDLVFNTLPPAGAVILVNSSTYYAHTSTLTVDGLNHDARFGESVSCNTNGSQVMIGAPYANNGQGTAYVFDRSIQRFQVADSAQTQYTTVQDLQDPGFVTVRLNGVFLVNTDLNVGGTFTINSNTVTIIAPLEVGDLLEVETNQFKLLENLTSNSPSSDARFGYKLDQCINNCSLYVAAPFDSTIITEAGHVEFLQNQSRVYGVTTSTIANPTLTIGDYIRINNYFVEVTGTSIASLRQDIVNAQIPNVTATLTPNLEFIGDGTTQVFDVGNIYSDAVSYTTIVLVDGVVKVPGTEYTYNPITQQINFTSAPLQKTIITIVSGRITISVKNLAASTPLARLLVLPGEGDTFYEIGFDTYVWEQTIASPVPQLKAHFGQGLFISDNTTTLLVGAPNGSMIRPTTFDKNTTRFDLYSTNFADPTSQSGALYSFDALPSANPSINNPLQFVFGQQFINDEVSTLDQFGLAIDYTTGVLLAGAPGSDLGDSTFADYGKVLQYVNTTNAPAWGILRRETPTVNTELLNSVFMYDLSSNSVLNYFDYFNPLQGKLLGSVQQNIDYIGAVDPAAYNTGPINNYGSSWAQNFVGKIWWDTNNVRFIDPNQGDLNYASRRWGQVFPGSTVDVYQWIVNDVPPDQYVGTGTVKDQVSYTVSSSIDEQGFVTTQYYYWVRGVTEVDTAAHKTLSAETIARYIESPRSSGIPYIAPLSANAVALYNAAPYIVAENTILHIEFDQILNSAAVHEEFQLIAQDRPESFIAPNLYRKFLDSMSGTTVTGAPVPNPLLGPSEQYGVLFNPRQSMFVDRFAALENYLTAANIIMAQYPITEIRSLNLLNSAEPEPSVSSGQWNKRVANIEELGYQDLNEVPLGYKYLVTSDSTNDGLWTIYIVNQASSSNVSVRILTLYRVQNYDTKRYWNRIDWYLPSYNKMLRIATEVPNVASLNTLTVPNGTPAKVTSNGQGLWELYQYNNGTWIRVGLENGTVEFSSTLWDYLLGRFGFDAEVFDSQYFDQAPITETRKVLEAINEELLIDDLAIHRNRLLILMFNFILSEQIAPDWLIKTSLIDVDHTIRELTQFQVYRADNQDFVLDYINEVKPYHVQIRQFNLRYQGNDSYYGDVTDFDLPAYYDTAQRMFISPVLDNTGMLSTTSSVPSTSPVWQTFPYNQWYQNYLLSIDSITIVDGGTGYISPPEIIVSGECTIPATMVSRINSAGQVVEVIVINPGSGYKSTATIEFTSTGGTGARAVAVMGNSQVRNIKTTMRFDRYQYSSNVIEWQSNASYASGTLVRYADRVWEAPTAIQSTEFDPTQWILIPASDLSGVDRTMGYYQPDVNMPGLDLALLISGVDYPGVQVSAPLFSQNTGFDVGNFDINPFDNISYGPEGKPTYDPAILDTIYESNFSDPYLGTLPAPAYAGDPPNLGPNPIVVAGGAFVDTFESHAPEELVPGITYDTLDFRVYTTPGADWLDNGHGFDVAHVNYIYSLDQNIYSFKGVMKYPVGVTVYNLTRGIAYPNAAGFLLNWPSYALYISPTTRTNISPGDEIVIQVYGVGGGNIGYIGTGPFGDMPVLGRSAYVTYPYDQITSMAIFKNGTFLPSNQYVYSSAGPNATGVFFNTPLVDGDRFTVVAYGPTYELYNGLAPSWSTPATQTIQCTTNQTYTLTNSMSGTNPANIIVEKNGVRARSPEGALYFGDGTTVDYDLPNKGGYDLALVANNDVAVYVNNLLLTQGVGYVVNDAISPTVRSITLTNTPAIGDEVLISVRSRAQYWVVGNILYLQSAQGLTVGIGDVLTITSFNDTSEQSLLTQVFVGPATSGIVISESYSSTLYDEGNITNDPGSFDYQEGTLITTNTFDVGRVIIDPERLWVSLDGRYLFPNEGFTVSGTIVTLLGAPINAAQTVVITSMTNSVTPYALAFRIFQDMRGTQSTYRITTTSSTLLSQACTATDDVIYVADATVLSPPDLPDGIFGLVTINGERIAYRELDLDNNTISGLRRGTAGTGAAAHDVRSAVYDIGIGNLLPENYQDHYLITNILANGTQTIFTADYSIPSGTDESAVLVYVGGILQTSGYTVNSIDPVQITFTQAPTAGYQVSIRVRTGLSWYQPGIDTASDGVPLQDTNTLAARFIRGLI